MMKNIRDKIISANQIIKLCKSLHIASKKIVLIGGCFDILHIGHIAFLEEAKKQGDILIVLLEHDETIKKSKGANRPINTQEDRAIILASLSVVDYIILLPSQMEHVDYDTLVFEIKPAIIATTKGDSFRYHKERQAKKIGAVVKDVTDIIKDKSTTKLFDILKEI